MGADVSRSIEEQLSAFLDGELPEAELQLLVRRLERDEGYRATLARYSYIGSVVRNDVVLPGLSGLPAGMPHADQDEELIADTQVQVAVGDETMRIRGGARRTRLGGFLAAACAVLAVVGYIQLPPTGLQPDSAQLAGTAAVSETSTLVTNTGNQNAGNSGSSVSSDSFSTVQTQQRRSSVHPDRMMSYLVSHGEFSRSQGTMVDSRIFVQQASFEQ